MPNVYIRIMADHVIFDDIGVQDLTEEDIKRLNLLREAIAKQGRLQIRYKRHLRIVAVHRVWLQDDGGFLAEMYQQGGGSGWGGLGGGSGGGGFISSPLGGWEGWIYIEFEKIESIEPLRGTFTPRRDFNPNPRISRGRVIWQISD